MPADGDRIRITAELLDVATGHLLRTVKVDGRIEEIFALQDRIVYELGQGLNLALGPAEMAGIGRDETTSLEAYEAYSRGLMNLRMATRESIDHALVQFERATSLDPFYARAWAALGRTRSLEGEFLEMPELVRQGVEAIRRAFELDATMAQAHASLGQAYLVLGTARRGARRHRRGHPARPGQRVGARGPGPGALARQGGDRSRDRRPRARRRAEPRRRLHVPAARAAPRAEEPVRPGGGGGPQGGRPAGAVPVRVGRSADRRRAPAPRLRVLRRGRSREAIREYERELAFLGSGHHALAERTLIETELKLAAAYWRQGDQAAADRFFERAIRTFRGRQARGTDDPATAYYIAAAHALRGDAAKAVRYLEASFARLQSLNRVRASLDPDFDPVRGDPGVQALVPPDAAAAPPVRHP